MRKIFISLIFILTISGLTHSCLAQNVIPHPVPDEYISSQYSVLVNDKPVQVFHAGLNVCFASFDFEGMIKVKVTAATIRSGKTTDKQYAGQVYYKTAQSVEGTEFWAGNASVKPSSKNIKPETDGAVVTFSLSEPGQYTVERPGTSNYTDQVLFLFASRPEKELPKAGDPGVIYLGPGVHQQNIDLQSGQTLYLDAGAVLYGAVNIWNAENVKILGRGTVVYCGPQAETRWYAAELNNYKNWHPLTTHNSKNIKVSGVTFICKSRIWLVRMHSTFDALFDNVKLISVNPMNVNGDGFDWQGGGRTKIMNSLVRSADDCFAFFTYDPAAELPSDSAPGAEAVRLSYEVKDVQIENCVLWTTIANIYRVGGGGMSLRTENITMKNCDVIHCGRGEWLAPWSILCSVNNGERAPSAHENYLFENIRLEEANAFIGMQNEDASFKNVVFRNIIVTGNIVPSLVKCPLDGLIFDNVKVNGKLVKSKEDVPFGTVTSEVKNLQFK